MRVLVDTNIFLEVLLAQARAREARQLLETADRHDLSLSDFSLHSIGLLLFRRQRHARFRQFVEEVPLSGAARLVSLVPADLGSIGDVARRFGLDFDDAYQYAAAQRHGLTIVSFDSDFDRTDRGRQTPAQVLAS